MEVDALRPDRSIGQEQVADYWREKAECLEQWVCELLRKNHTLRMDLQRDQSEHQQREETTVAYSLVSFNRRPFPTERPSFGTTATIHVDLADPPCPRKECAEVRESVIRYAVMRDFDREASN
jgi:hypothetical protein